LDEYPRFVGEFKSQAISNTVWGVATLISNKEKRIRGNGEPVLSEREQQAALTIARHCLQSVVQRRALGFVAQDLCNTVWAVATFGFGMTTTASAKAATINNYIVLTSLQPTTDAQLMVAAIQSICEAARPLLPRFSPQGLSSLAWALARLLSDDSNNSNTNVVAALGRDSSWPAIIQSLLFGIGP
jgi:hypothetical protein